MVYDIAVIGGGPAGGHAALIAAAAGCKVALIDEQPRAGGQVWRAKSAAILSAPATPESLAGDRLRAQLAASDIACHHGARLWQIAPADGLWQLHLGARGGASTVTARRVILAGGAREYVQPFPGWTTPGVIGLAGATALMKQDQSPPARRVVVAGNGPLVFFVAAEIRRLGGTVAAVVTQNSRRDWLAALPAMVLRPDLLARGALWLADLTLARVPVYWRHTVTAATGDAQLTDVEIRPCDAQWRPLGPPVAIRADALCIGHGLLPDTRAAQLAGARLRHVPALGGWLPDADASGATDVAGLFVCGDGAGIRGAAAAQLGGAITGAAAARSCGFAVPPAPYARFLLAARFGAAMTSLSRPRAGQMELTTADTILCRCESLTRADLAGEIASGAGSLNAVKSGRRAGMGPCGGAYCQTALARLIAQTRGLDEAQVPLATARPPLRPVPLADLAGDFDYDSLPIPKPAPL